LAYETVTLVTEDGFHLVAWYVPSQNQAAIILQHGYKDTRAGVLPLANILARHGYGVMMVDLRAHGESDGDTIFFGLHEVRDVEAAYQYLLAQPDVDPDRIGALGISMGGSVLLLHAAQNPGIKAIVADSAYTSLPDEVGAAVAQTGLPAFLLAPMVQWFAERETGFDATQIAPIKHISSISPRPVFLIQGGKDLTVPLDSAQRLYDAARPPRELWIEPNKGHVVSIFVEEEEFESRVIEFFFNRYLLGE
jgi:dipeptidyl aminopeptidase/acylaminoacyl peptidase